MPIDKFPVGVVERLKWYVYRLIDPRNGETFYVGKGQGDRVFEHVRGALKSSKEEGAFDLKFQRIKDITAASLEVAHVIHRHNIDNATIAFQIEAALIDAYPGLANQIGGHGSDDYGARHVSEIVADYEAQEFEPMEPLVLISIGQSYEDEETSIYEAVRGCWRIKKVRAQKCNLVLAHRRGLVLGAFRPTAWLPFTMEDFPLLRDEAKNQGRFGFVGEPADEATRKHYVGRRVPDVYRTKGASNPIRIIEQSPMGKRAEGKKHPRWTTGPEGIRPLGVITKTIDYTTPAMQLQRAENEAALKKARQTPED